MVWNNRHAVLTHQRRCPMIAHKAWRLGKIPLAIGSATYSVPYYYPIYSPAEVLIYSPNCEREIPRC
jgi:hypothetical protein